MIEMVAMITDKITLPMRHKTEIVVPSTMGFGRKDKAKTTADIIPRTKFMSDKISVRDFLE